jgi:hypothetical protein
MKSDTMRSFWIFLIFVLFFAIIGFISFCNNCNTCFTNWFILFLWLCLIVALFIMVYLTYLDYYRTELMCFGYIHSNKMTLFLSFLLGIILVCSVIWISEFRNNGSEFTLVILSILILAVGAVIAATTINLYAKYSAFVFILLWVALFIYSYYSYFYKDTCV